MSEARAGYYPIEYAPATIVNVGSHGESETERMLSNFAPTPFELDGRTYQSVESFWQGLYFPEGSLERDEIAGISGGQAKRAGKLKRGGLTHVVYQGKPVEIGSPEHHELMRQALRAKFSQNRLAFDHLLSTAGSTITHVLTRSDGTIIPDSRSIPGRVFSQILMGLREDFALEILDQIS